MEEKEVRKKFSIAKLLIILLILYIIGFYMYKIVVSPINNIYIKGNTYLSDQEVIDISGLRNYPSFLLTFKHDIRKKLLKNEMVKEVHINKKLGNVVTITIEEYKPLFTYKDKTVLENGKTIDKKYNLPILINNVDDDLLVKLSEKYSNVNDEIKLMISEIKYDPNNIDKERFLFTMNDGNYVYVTLYKITSINEYIKILPKTEGKKGILYLDSGNYFEKFKDSNEEIE